MKVDKDQVFLGEMTRGEMTILDYIILVFRYEFVVRSEASRVEREQS
jgi:hypothetical protein